MARGQGRSLLREPKRGANTSLEDGVGLSAVWGRACELQRTDEEPLAASAVRVNRSDGVILRRLKVSWTHPDLTAHGPYGLYPVLSGNVLLEDSTVVVASDSGICGSQLTNSVLRRNDLHGNVAGIIVRNAHVLDVLDNDVHDNSVGIVMGTLPGDEQLNGHDLRIANNRIVNNNVPGYDRPGETVDRIPSGAALVINGNNRVEIFGNTITGNSTNAVSIVSLLFAAEALPTSHPRTLGHQRLNGYSLMKPAVEKRKRRVVEPTKVDRCCDPRNAGGTDS